MHEELTINMDPNQLAKIVHQANINWWIDIHTGQPIKRNYKLLLLLVISEVIECLEGERKNLMDDKLPHRKMAEVEMADAYIRLLDYAGGMNEHISTIYGDNPEAWDKDKSEIGEQLFDMVGDIVDLDHTRLRDDDISVGSRGGIGQVLCSIRAYCYKHGYDLDGAFKEKMAFNAQRADHKHENRREAHGKAF